MNKRDHLHATALTASGKRLEFEQFLANLSAKFVALPPEEVDDEIQNALNEVLRFFQIDRCSLLRLLPGKELFMITHNADIMGLSPYPVETPMPVSLFPYFYKTFTEHREHFSFASLADLPEEAAAEKKFLEDWKVQSGVYVPIAALKSTAEYTLGISSAEKDKTCPEEYIPRLRLLGELFVNTLERSMGEQALRESEERLSLAASAAEAGLWIFDSDKGIVWSTQQLRKLFRFDPDKELSFDRFLEAIHPDDREDVRKRILQSLDKREALKLEYRIIRSDGDVRWISSSGNLSSDGPGGLPERLMGVSIDVTERRQMEIELRERLEEIERLKLQRVDYEMPVLLIYQ